MKAKLAALFAALTATLAFGHGGVEIGPNGGRILEFSKNETMHGEVTVKDGKFNVAILDKDMKPVKVAEQTLAATSAAGETGKGTKIEVTRTESGFTLPAVKDGEWLILQFRENAKGKAITARMHYDTGTCEECKEPEWLCKCKAADKKGEKKEEPKKDAGKKVK